MLSHPDQGGHRMKLHANARTCPNSRRLLVKRIEEEGWSLMVAAEAAGISERSARKWLARWRAEGEAGLLDRSSAPRRVPSRLPADRLEAIEALRRLRMTAAEIAEVLGHGALDRLAVAGADRAGQAQPPGAPRAAQPLRAKAPRRADPRRRQEAGADRRKGAGHRVTGNRKSQVNDAPAAAASPAGSSSTSASMTPPAWPTSRCCPTRSGATAAGVPASGRRLV